MTRVNARGQIIIPKHLRERYGLKGGDDIEFIEQEGSIFTRKVEKESHHHHEELKRRALAAAGSTDLGAPDIARRHDEYWAEDLADEHLH